MDAKLTLKLDQYVIEKAKEYASKKNISLSRIIEAYLATLTSEQLDEFEISPFVRSISNGNQVPLDVENQAKDDRIDYLDKKYQ